jgi:glutamate-ammonia-ligase adenylyltransferase
MQHQNLFPVLKDLRSLERPKPKKVMAQELGRAVRAAHDLTAKKIALNRYKDREMFRIDMRHIQGKVGTFDEFSAELTDLTEVVITEAAAVAHSSLEKIHGRQICDDGGHCTWAVMALGKFGGRELGYGSDIELLFVYRAQGRTSGTLYSITCGEFFEKLVSRLRDFIVAKHEGIFEIDLRLRPHGKKGPLATTLENFRHYFAPGGGAAGYERQALVKMRYIAGDEALGREVEAARDEIVFGSHWLDRAFSLQIAEMRKRQIAEHVPSGTVNVKLSPGGLVDVEYLVQGLQIAHARSNPALRTTNTLQAIRALAQHGCLTSEIGKKLEEAYTFLRVLIDALRVVRGSARDLALPRRDSEEFKFLARRVYKTGDDAEIEERLAREVERYMGDVRAMAEKAVTSNQLSVTGY